MKSYVVAFIVLIVALVVFVHPMQTTDVTDGTPPISSVDVAGGRAAFLDWQDELTNDEDFSSVGQDEEDVNDE